MSNDIILAALSTEPQTAAQVAEKLGKPVSTVRKWLKRLRDAGQIAFKKIGNAIAYYVEQVAQKISETVEKISETIEKISETIKPTRHELYLKLVNRAESHRQKMLASTSRYEAKMWRHRYTRANNRAAALAC